MNAFVTVGTQLAFDRLIRTVDNWVGARGDVAAHAQIGPTAFAPRHMTSDRFVSPEAFLRLATAADVIVAHAGTGSILAGLEARRPVIVLPRRAELGEHRNDHQLATADRLGHLEGIHVAWDENQLTRLLERANRLDRPQSGLGPHASSTILRALSDFINLGSPVTGRRSRSPQASGGTT